MYFQYSGSKSKPSNKPDVGMLLGLLFNPEDGGNMFLQHINLSMNYMVLEPR
jgi:hypothetical protein